MFLKSFNRRSTVLAAGAAMAAPLLLAQAGQAEVIDFLMTLDGDQENPPVITDASGSGTATLDTDTNVLSWEITFSDLSSTETAAHFHGPAELCENTGIQVGLELGSPKIGEATVTDEQEADILAGLWYVNVHTMMHPSGEIRGQVYPAPLENPIKETIPRGDIHILPQLVADGMTAPNWGTSAPGDDRLFVTDQDGILWALDLESGEKSVFLDVTDRLVDLGIGGPGTFDERGLLGVAFHPQYAANGKLYTYTSEPADREPDYSTMPDDVKANHQSVIAEWVVPSPGDPASFVDPGSRRELLRIDEPQFNHNAGAIDFGPDDLLYIALGDGGRSDDRADGHSCHGNAQDISNPLGSILRIDPDGNDSPNGQYGIPDDNPFVGSDGLDEIWAYGLRNPFRFSFDQMTGEMFIADVGQNDLEEINIGMAGANYGWNYKEGSFFFSVNGNEAGYVTDMPLAAPDDLIDPIAEYDHDDGRAVVGGFVSRGTRVPALYGSYIFGDFDAPEDPMGRLFHLTDSNEIVEFEFVDSDALGLFVLGFAQDADGDVYILANSTGVPFEDTGVVLRIAMKPGDQTADGVVGLTDLIKLLQQWGPCEGCPADFDGDGVVGNFDLLVLLHNWG